ncbi:ribonuclease P protein component [Candidatus Dependentiae bacterium]|nr:ribonuclease P protein component [Candidatus Dependentiae bacterium]
MPKIPTQSRAVSLFTAREIRTLLTLVRSVYYHSKLVVKAALKAGISSKILIVTPKRMGSAPSRNLMKRRLKSLFYQEKHFQNQFDLVVYCKKGSELITYVELTEIIKNALNEAQRKLLKHSNQSV